MTPEIKMTNEQLSPVKGRIHYTAYRGVLDRQDVIVEEYFFYGCLPHLVVQTGPSEWINIFTLFSFTEKYGGILLPSMRHRNIVDILGYCTEKPEKIFVVFKCPRNGNLRNYLFRSNHNKEWSIHERIIEGIADGISYLHYGFQHEYLIHGDLNLSSIWLDDCWNAQISNFSYTRILDMNGTCTAVASLLQRWEYLQLWIILLQILIDKKGGGFSAYPSSLLEVWNKWKRDKMLELLDPEIQNCCPDKALRYFQIALLCIQAEPDKRPDAKEVVTMLSRLDDLPIPTPPDFRF
ncbi:S-locus lectin protein kinase family protein [Rhynchospora pubera]|uniref:S-locus lectin protein kinase family protein n=1 Tax=Rhynchospora pubera TaxID=906938 RepID=A0AAV8GPW7_9POAL|nr:S-locus lectin protein kinase family protein [Rhynchospora pubera]